MTQRCSELGSCQLDESRPEMSETFMGLGVVNGRGGIAPGSSWGWHMGWEGWAQARQPEWQGLAAHHAVAGGGLSSTASPPALCHTSVTGAHSNVWFVSHGLEPLGKKVPRGLRGKWMGLLSAGDAEVGRAPCLLLGGRSSAPRATWLQLCSCSKERLIWRLASK